MEPYKTLEYNIAGKQCMKNNAIKQAKEKAEEYNPVKFDNGDTLKQLLARSGYLLFKSPDKWTKLQEIRANILFNVSIR